MAEPTKKKLTELRVVDLRAELDKRGEDKTGIKAVLIERLQKAIESEGGDPDNILVDVDGAGDGKAKMQVKKTPTRKTKEKSKEEDEAKDEPEETTEPEQDGEAEEEEEAMETEDVVDEVTDEVNEEVAEEMNEEVTEEAGDEETKVETEEMEQENGTDEKTEVEDETEEDLNEGDVININAEEDQLLIEDEVEGSSDEKVESSTLLTPEKAVEESPSAPPTPGSVPVKAPLTKEDTIKMDTSAVAKTEDNISLVVHADDLSIMELDADLQEDEKKDGAEKGDEKPKESVESSATDAKAKEQGDEASKTIEKSADAKDEKKDEAKKIESGDKKSEDASKTSKDITAGKKSPSSASSNARTKSATSKEANKPVAKDDKDRRGSSSRTSSSSSGKNLWVSNLSSSTKATDLKSAFSKYGKVVGAKIVTNAHSPGARCYGFVTMSSHAEANKAFNHLHRTELHGRIIYVEWAKTDPAASARKPADKKDAGTKAVDAKKDPKAETKDTKTTATASTGTAAKKEADKPATKAVAKPTAAAVKKDADKTTATPAKRDDKSTTEKKPEPANKPTPDKTEKKDDKQGAAAKGRTVVMDKSKGEPVVSVKTKKDEKGRDRSGSASSTKKPGEKKDILSFDQIKEKREKERQRQRERELREMERRRERERQEKLRRDREVLRRKQREEEERIRRERELVAVERERLNKERMERERLEQERMRLQRERIREQERLEREREEQRRLEVQLRLEQERRAGLKRTYESRNMASSDTSYYGEQKRMAMGFDSSDMSHNDSNRYSDFDLRDRSGQMGDSHTNRSSDPFERRVERYDRRDGRTLDSSQKMAVDSSAGGSRYNDNRFSDNTDSMRRRDDTSYRSDTMRRDDSMRGGHGHGHGHDNQLRRDTSTGVRRDTSQSHRVDSMSRADHTRRDTQMRRDEPIRRDDSLRRRSDITSPQGQGRREEPVRRDAVRDRDRTDRRVVMTRGAEQGRGRVQDHRDDSFSSREPAHRDRSRGSDMMQSLSRNKDKVQPMRDTGRPRPGAQTSRRMDSPTRRGSGSSRDWKTDDDRRDIRGADRRDRISDTGRHGVDTSYSRDSRQQDTHYSSIRQTGATDSWQTRGLQDDRGVGRSDPSRGHSNLNFGPGLLGAAPVQDEQQQWPQGGLENPTVNRHGDRWPGAPGNAQLSVQRQPAVQATNQTAPILGQQPRVAYLPQASQPTGAAYMMAQVQASGSFKTTSERVLGTRRQSLGPKTTITRGQPKGGGDLVPRSMQRMDTPKQLQNRIATKPVKRLGTQRLTPASTKKIGLVYSIHQNRNAIGIPSHKSPVNTNLGNRAVPRVTTMEVRQRQTEHYERRQPSYR